MEKNTKIILTSTGFTNNEVVCKIKKILDTSFEETKVLIIPTARKNIYNKEKYANSFLDIGFKRDNLVFFDDEKANLFKQLDIDMIYVCGGNTFLLQKHILECGFDKEIKKYVANGVIYIGASAGSHIVTEDIEHVSYFDKNDVKIKDFKGLSLFDGILICHYDETRKDVYDKLKNKYKNIYLLNDTEILYKENNNVYKL